MSLNNQPACCRKSIAKHSGAFVKNACLPIILFLALSYSALLGAECQSRITLTKLNNQYSRQEAGIVLDTYTGLAWKKCPEGLRGNACEIGTALAVDWLLALDQANNSSFGGYSDWRLPNKKELASLVEKACFSPAINSSIYPGTAADVYWTSSPSAASVDNAWVVDFELGYSDAISKKGDAHVRLVRGGN